MAEKAQQSQGDAAGLISPDLAARLLMIQTAEFEALARAGWFKAATKNPTRYQLAEVVQGFIKSMKHEAERGRTAAEVAIHIDLSTRRIVDLLNEGVIERKERAGYNLDEVRTQYIRHLRAVAAGHGENGQQSLANERAALAREQRDSVAIRNAIARGDFVSLSEVRQINERIFSVIRENLLTLPGKLGDELANRERAEITERLETEIFEALNELAEPSSYGRPPVGGDAGDDEGVQGAAAPLAH